MLLSWLFDNNTRVVRRHVRANNPPEARAAYEHLYSLRWNRWRIWKVLASAHWAESKVASVEGRPFNDSNYKKLLRNAGNYPDGYTAEYAQEVIERDV